MSRANIKDIKRIYLRIDTHKRTERINSETGLEQDVLWVESFLLQVALLEGVLVNTGLELLDKRKDLSGLKGKRKNRYGYDNAINDLYLMGAIDTEEFKLLEQYKAKRNIYVHNLLSKKIEKVEDEVLKVCEDYEDFVWKMIKKLQRLIKKS